MFSMFQENWKVLFAMGCLSVYVQIWREKGHPRNSLGPFPLAVSLLLPFMDCNPQPLHKQFVSSLLYSPLPPNTPYPHLPKMESQLANAELFAHIFISSCTLIFSFWINFLKPPVTQLGTYIARRITALLKLPCHTNYVYSSKHFDDPISPGEKRNCNSLPKILLCKLQIILEKGSFALKSRCHCKATQVWEVPRKGTSVYV